MKTSKKKILESIDKFESENMQQVRLSKEDALFIKGGLTVDCNDAEGCLHKDELTVGTPLASDLVIGPYAKSW